jgi:exopolyphosphatase/guanosine-5'-triphosphate,3'-diphosphate pyrophosphatase
MIFAAIDIGSNAARLLFANVYNIEGKIIVDKATLIRIPTRLGKDVYSINKISRKRADNLIKTLNAFKLLIEVYQPISYTACATAAMREAENGPKIIKQIKEKVGFDVRIIDGMEEANIVRQTHKTEFKNPKLPTMYIDVGGGSTEISILKNGELVDAKSFKIGTLRLLSEKVAEENWMEMEDWLMQFQKDFGKINVVGSGGNINKINKLYGNPINYILSHNKLQSALDHLKSFTLVQRIEKLGLRPDRADVIVPAAEIFLFIVNIIRIESLLVPKIGMADGLIFQLYQEHISNKGKSKKPRR